MIEVTRVGEHCRGFVVVADEVSKLAKNTTWATDDVSDKVKYIQTLIKQTS